MRLLVLFALPLMAAGCSEPEPEAPVDIEQMNKDALGPPFPINLEVLQPAEIGQAGPGCHFMRAEGGETLLVTDERSAFFRVDGEVLQATSDAGSEELPSGAYSRYAGMANAVTLTIDRNTSDPVAPGRVSYSGTVSISDQYDRPVFTATGVLDCGTLAQAP